MTLNVKKIVEATKGDRDAAWVYLLLLTRAEAKTGAIYLKNGKYMTVMGLAREIGCSQNYLYKLIHLLQDANLVYNENHTFYIKGYVK